MTTMILVEEKVPGKPLGRHVEHDPRSKDYPWEMTATPLHSVTHRRHGSIFNQGEIGSCTGNAAAGAANTEPFYSVDKHPLLHESDALKIYEEATAIDNIPGTYPPDDTGSSGLSVAKVLKNRYFISSYKHAFDVPSALNALMHQAVIMGCCWYEGFDTPDADGIVAMTGQIRGGHEVMSREYEMLGPSPGDDDLVWFDNSWTTSWGVKGRFAMRVSTLRPLLVQQGDITILVP